MKRKLSVKQKARKRKSNRCFRHSFAGFITGKYDNMRARVLGRHGASYRGLPICTLREFQAWAKYDRNCIRLFNAWVLSGYKQELTPTIDRVDSRGGYTLTPMNMRFCLMKDNRAAAVGERRLRKLLDAIGKAA